MNLRPAPALRDAAVAVIGAAAALLVQIKTDTQTVDPALHDADLLTFALTGIAPLTLFWWRSHPLRALAALVFAATVVSATGHYVGLLPWLAAVSLGAVGVRGPRRDSLGALGVALLSYTCLTVIGVPDNSGDSYISTIALLAAFWAVGDGIRLHRAQVAADLRAAQRDAVAAREEAARATSEERLRIARELHDVVAHSMSLIAVHAGVGAHLIRTKPEQAERALEVIADTSREALAQTRSLLQVLRQEEDGPRTAPVPRLAELEPLLDTVRHSGLAVDLRVDGSPNDLSMAVQLAAYRIVQESLTNVVRHANATAASVRLDYGSPNIEIEVVDNGIGHHAAPQEAPVDHGRHGLRGLRERATLLGGSLSAGPRAGGGYRVAATLPVDVPPHGAPA